MSPELIKQTVCKACDTSIEDVLSSTKKKEAVEARAMIFNLIKEKTGHSLAKVGQMVGNKCESVVYRGIHTFHNLYKTDKYFRMKYDGIKGSL